ncbi:MAG: hypothetical protein ABI850_06020 [Flavobacterium sp.]
MTKIKLSILGLLALFLSATIFVACSRGNDENTLEATTQKGTGLVDPVEFGKLHNKYLIEAINISNNNRKLSSKQSFMTVKIANVSTTNQSRIYDNISNISSVQMKDTIFSYLKNPLAKEYFNKTDIALKNATTYKELNDELDNIVLLINTDLSGKDWDVVMVYLETIRASANVWYSEEMGGSGIGYNYRKLNSYNSKISKQKLPDYILADGRGAGYGMVAWSFSAFLGPVGGVGFVYGAVSGAVFSSLDAL